MSHQIIIHAGRSADSIEFVCLVPGRDAEDGARRFGRVSSYAHVRAIGPDGEFVLDAAPAA